MQVGDVRLGLNASPTLVKKESVNLLSGLVLGVHTSFKGGI